MLSGPEAPIARPVYTACPKPLPNQSRRNAALVTPVPVQSLSEPFPFRARAGNSKPQTR